MGRGNTHRGGRGKVTEKHTGGCSDMHKGKNRVTHIIPKTHTVICSGNKQEPA